MNNFILRFFLSFALVQILGCDKQNSQFLEAAKKLPGYMRSDQCLPYAKEAVKYWQAQGKSARVLSFVYDEQILATDSTAAMFTETTGTKIAHAICVWKDGNSWYATDNLNPYPFWIWAKPELDELDAVKTMYPTAVKLIRTP